MMTITYRETKGKFVICKDGIYLPLTKSQVGELQNVLEDIQAGTNIFYKEDARRGETNEH